ncbi:MAG: erythromycin esterase family protein [Emcibacteraceae bacterium]
MEINENDAFLISAIEKCAYPAGEATDEYDSIIEASSDKQFVLIGEASHGTEEFYRTRSEISQRLIEEKGFDAVAVEADWPDAYAVNRFVCDLTQPSTAEEALSRFERFPTWMWANYEILHFIKWLRAFNEMFHKKTKSVGFYGLDLYSMNTSVNAVIDYLKTIDIDAAERARQRYSCLEYFADEKQTYSYELKKAVAKSCEKEIIDQLIDLRKKAYHYLQRDGLIAEDEYFCAEQNARLIKNGQEYYSSMFASEVTPRPNLWNLRDRHMFGTLENLKKHLSNQLGRKAKIIVWAHNSHIGNAAATEMSHRGEYNIGQMVRQTYQDQALLVGFSTARGTVTAASNWSMPAECKKIRLPIPGSYEDIFHKVNKKNFLLDLRENNNATDKLYLPRLQRAIGVIYRPETERQSHYFHAVLPAQFDFMIHFDESNALEPMDVGSQWQRIEQDETFPSGL